MKTCSKCKLGKSEEDFYLRSDTGNREANCKVCCLAQQKAYRKENREKTAAQKKIYYAENQEKIVAYRKENREKILARNKVYYTENQEKIVAYRKENREKSLAQNRLYKYGITPDAFKRMLAKQGGVCAVCGKEATFHVDHDHETGKVRGLLCGFCNRGLGLLKDSSAIAQLATNYLKQHGK